MYARSIAVRLPASHLSVGVAAFVLALALMVVPAPARAASLTSAQVSGVIGLLSAFGVDATTINNVRTILNGGSATTQTQTQQTETQSQAQSQTQTEAPSTTESSQTQQSQAVSSSKPNTAQFAAAAKTDTTTASSMLYGVIGSNQDLRDWAAIMASSNPLAAARAATAAMYNSGSTSYLASGATRPAGRANTTVLASYGNFTLYKEILPGNLINYVLALVDKNGYQLTSAANSGTLTKLITNFGFNKAELSVLQAQLDQKGINLQAVTSWSRGFVPGLATEAPTTATNTETSTNTNTNTDTNTNTNTNTSTNTASGTKPNTAQFVAAAKTDASTASSMLYGVIGSNTDVRDWSVIMSSTNPLATARALTSAMYNSGATSYLASGATRPADRANTTVLASSGNFTFYKEIIPGVGVNYVLALVDANGYQLTSAANSGVLLKHITNFGFNKADLSALQSQLDSKGINLQSITSWPRNFGISSAMFDGGQMMAAAAAIPMEAMVASINLVADQIIEVNWSLASVLSAYAELFGF